MSIYEPLFFQYSVDFVISGHVHAYERTHPLYKYALNPLGPVYLTLGDGGNIEGPYRSFVDDEYSPGVTFCQQAWASKNFATGFITTPTYQLSQQPPTCNAQTFQPSNGILGQPGVVASPFNAAQFWCQSSQPVWSAHRDPSFGFSGITFVDDNHATYNWYRNIDQSPSAATLVSGDSATYVRQTVGFNSPPPPAPPSPPTPSPPTFIISSSATLTGISAASFTQSAVPAFQAGIMAALGASAVTVTGITANTRRSLLQSSLVVSFTATTTPANVVAYNAAVAANPAYLAAAFQAAGLGVTGASTPTGTFPQVGSMGIDATPTLSVAGGVKSAPTVASQHKPLSIGLGVGIGLGAGLPLALIAIYYINKGVSGGAAPAKVEPKSVEDVVAGL